MKMRENSRVGKGGEACKERPVLGDSVNSLLQLDGILDLAEDGLEGGYRPERVDDLGGVGQVKHDPLNPLRRGFDFFLQDTRE